MNEKNKEYTTIDLVELMKSFWQKRMLIVALVIVGAMLMFLKVHFFTEDTYTASGTLYVSSQSTLSTTQDITQSTITSARTLSETYIEMLKTRSFLTDVSVQSGSNYTWSQIKSMMTVDSVNETELLSVSVTAANADDAYRIAKSVLDLAPKKMESVFNGGRVSIVDDVIRPVGANANGMLKQVVMGGLIGGVLALAIIFLIDFFDTRVRKAEDVAKRYNLSILGEIAEM